MHTAVNELMQDNSIEEYARGQHEHKRENDLLFSYDLGLYRSKKLKSGEVKVKMICNGVPSLIGPRNKRDQKEQDIHYEFVIRSKNFGLTNIFMSSKNLLSSQAFKRKILKHVPVLFFGGNSDFSMFIRTEMDAFEL